MHRYFRAIAALCLTRSRKDSALASVRHDRLIYVLRFLKEEVIDLLRVWGYPVTVGLIFTGLNAYRQIWVTSGTLAFDDDGN
jgi:hypothetical protein